MGAAFSPKANNGLKDDKGLDIPCEEVIDNESLDDALFEDDHIQISQTLVINWKDLERAIKGILGYAAKSPKAPSGLHRVIPRPHPKFYWLWAKRISGGKGINPLGNAGIGHGGGSAVGSTYANYQFCKLNILYEARPYTVIADAVTGADESTRFIEPFFDGEPMLLSSDRGQMGFTDPAASSWGEAVRGPVGYALSKGLLLLRWHNVDPAFVSTNKNQFLDNIHPLMNTVNLATFQGFPAGTLRMGKPKIISKMFPADPSTLGIPISQPPRSYTIEISATWFDPPRGASTFRGHVLAPDPKSGAGNWYRITTNGPAFRPLFQSADWSKVFKSV